jgi:hypothetical protein
MDSKTFVVVFDFDETIGDFTQPYRFWTHLKQFLKDKDIYHTYFFSFLDLFPGFFRSGLFKILNTLKKKKILGKCNYVMIYTNNIGPNYWVDMIILYINTKLEYKLFDKVIRSFKINGLTVEPCRTSYSKSYKDLLRCSNLPVNSKICFIDDKFHTEMENENVVYIFIDSYRYNLGYDEIYKKYYSANNGLFSKYNKTKLEFIEYMKKHITEESLDINKTLVQKNIDLLISDKIIRDILFFLGDEHNYTKKKQSRPLRNRTCRI